MQFKLFDQKKEDEQRAKFGNALTKSNQSSTTPVRFNALLQGSKKSKTQSSDTSLAFSENRKQNMNNILQLGSQKYAAQEADAIIQAMEQDPLAFEYDAHYDKN